MASSILQSLDNLVQFPYGCVEQTVSRFLPAALSVRAAQNLGLPVPDLERKLPLIVKDGFARLAAMQHEDGGWGWWESDASDPFMTAWVLDALDQMQRLGYVVSPAIKKSAALKWAAAANLGDKKVADALYLVLELAKYGELNAAKSKLVTLKMSRAGDREYALAARAYQALGNDGQMNRALDSISDGTNLGEVGSELDDYGDEVAAIVLDTLVKLRPSDNRIAPLMQKILRSERFDEWS